MRKKLLCRKGMTSLILLTFLVSLWSAPMISFADTVLFEGFDIPDTEEGREFLGWNGWSVGYSADSGSINVRDSEFTIITEPGTTNKVARLYRSTSSANSVQYKVNKAPDRTLSSGVAKLSFRINPTTSTSNAFLLYVIDSTNSYWGITVDFSNSRINYVAGVVPFIGNTGSNPRAPINRWYTFDLYFNLTEKTFFVYQDGQQIGANIAIPSAQSKGNILELSISTDRKAAGNGACFYLDDISLQSMQAMQLTKYSPADQTTDVDINTKLELNFNYPVDKAALSPQNVSVSGAKVKSVSTALEDDTTCIVELEEPLAFDTNYTVEVSGIKNVYGQAAANLSYSFKTRSRTVSYQKPMFYLNDEGIFRDITETGLQSGEITAEVGIYNETNRQSDCVLVMQVVRNGKTLSTTSKSVKIEVQDEMQKFFVAAQAEEGDELKLTILDDWITMGAPAGTYQFNTGGLSQRTFLKNTKAALLHSAVNYKTKMLEITGKAENPSATLTMAFLKAGCLPEQITDENVNAAVYDIVQIDSKADASYQFNLDISDFEKNVNYTITAGGTAMDSYTVFDDDVIEAAINAVAIGSVQDLKAMLAGTKNFRGDILLNDVLQLDLTDFKALEYPDIVLEVLAGHRFNSLEAIRIAYYEILEERLTIEHREKEVLRNINEAPWDKMKTALVNSDDALKLNWDGSFQNLSSASENKLYKALALDYTFTSIQEIREAFSKEISKLLEEQDRIPSVGGNSGGGKKSVVLDYDAPIQKPEEKPQAITFGDIETVPWAKESIEALVAMGVVNGMDDKHFAPNDKVTREQFIKMIILAFDLNGGGENPQFLDVQSQAWYAPYIYTAVYHGLIQGIGDGNFGIGSYISRGDMAVICTRAAEASGIKLPKESVPAFSDIGSIPAYAMESAAMLQQAKIMTGDEEGRFEAESSSTRAMAAKVIYGLLRFAGN